MSRIEQQRRYFISFIPDNSHYILIKSKKKKEKVMAIKKLLTLYGAQNEAYRIMEG